MKKGILFVIILLLSQFGYSQSYKLVEQNPKNKPKWLTEGTGRGELMIQANKVATLEEAQNAVMSSLLNSIASSISVYVIGETVDRIDWNVVELNGKTREEFIQTVETNTTLKIAKMPALQGISLSKADVYWERYINKKTKETCYDYYILYPFSDYDLQELIDAYNAQEKAANDKIDNYKNSLEEMDNIDEMLDNIEQMKGMMQEMGEADAKYARLNDVKKSYEKALKDIYVEVLQNYNENNKGTLIIQLKYDEKIMKTKTLPQLRSSCARDFNRKHNGNKMVLTFNTFDCYEQDDNYVEVRFTFGKRKLIKKININL